VNSAVQIIIINLINHRTNNDRCLFAHCRHAACLKKMERQYKTFQQFSIDRRHFSQAQRLVYEQTVSVFNYFYGGRWTAELMALPID